MKENEIKAVDLVRRIRDEIAGELANMTPEQIMEFFNEAREEALAELRRKAPRSAPDRKVS